MSELTTLSLIGPIIIFCVTAIFYHLKYLSRLNRLEDNYEAMSERLERLEENLSNALVRLENKLDRFVYSRVSRHEDN